MNDCKACAEIIGDCLVCQKLQEKVWEHKLDMKAKWGEGDWDVGEHDGPL